MPFGKVGMEERMKELHIDRNGENGYLCGTYDQNISTQVD